MSHDTTYIGWLLNMVSKPTMSTFSVLAHSIKFKVLVDFDENRASDGLELRDEYEIKTHRDAGIIGGATLLEVMIGVARRLEDNTYFPDTLTRGVPYWYSILLNNLSVYEISNTEQVEVVFNGLNLRTYTRDGYGGLFPLRFPRGNQTETEIWYQMMAWLHENHRF